MKLNPLIETYTLPWYRALWDRMHWGTTRIRIDNVEYSKNETVRHTWIDLHSVLRVWYTDLFP